jgi:hypothetical protein
VFWYQLNPTAMPNPTVQSGQLDGGTGEHYFFPSIAANVVGDACVGFTRSDATRFAEAAFTGRLATDPSGTMQTIQQLKAGQSSYSKFFGGTENRWGDYSNTSVDPSDDLTFWTIQEYAAQNAGTGTNDGRWGTWWGKIETQSSLPIQLASLVATRAGSGAVHLEWTTLSEIDNYGFEVQRRGSVAIPFATIPNSFVPGSGTTIEPKRYRYDDISAGAGTSDYRLKQIDLNGAVHFSEPVAVAVAAGTGHAAGVPMESRLLQNYPNPFNPVTTIVYRVGGSEGLHEVRLEIFDVLGRRVATPVDERVAPGLHEVSFDASGLAGGVYLCRMSTDGWSGTIRLAVMR